jgi:hypothetical protein
MVSVPAGSPSQARSQAAASVLPRDEADGLAIDFLKAATDLLAPGFFRARINACLQTADQGVNQRGANFRWQGQSVFAALELHLVP